MEALRKKERQDETPFTTKIGGKTSLGPSYFWLVKTFIPSYAFDALLCWILPFSPPKSRDFTDNSNNRLFVK
jgi:hypothetical protein